MKEVKKRSSSLLVTLPSNHNKQKSCEIPFENDMILKNVSSYWHPVYVSMQNNAKNYSKYGSIHECIVFSGFFRSGL